MWHVSSRSGVASLRTAIHALLTYLLAQATSLFSSIFDMHYKLFKITANLYLL